MVFLSVQKQVVFNLNEGETLGITRRDERHHDTRGIEIYFC